MATKHYKLPYDAELDKDIIDWINDKPRNRKGEEVRNAIRLYMALEKEGKQVNIPGKINILKTDQGENQHSQSERNKKERKKPSFDFNPMINPNE